jgi:lactoylglutathione lyase
VKTPGFSVGTLGTENNPKFAGYINLNIDPSSGFSHIAITVLDVQEACDRFESLGVLFKRKLSERTIRNTTFALDRDEHDMTVDYCLSQECVD